MIFFHNTVLASCYSFKLGFSSYWYVFVIVSLVFFKRKKCMRLDYIDPTLGKLM